jgi:hypothetical protein
MREVHGHREQKDELCVIINEKKEIKSAPITRAPFGVMTETKV